MLLPENEFESSYGETYRAWKAEFEQYIAEPEVLKAKLEKEKLLEQKAWADSNHLPEPRADRYAYWSRIYRGLVGNPERLRNYVVAKSEQRSLKRKSLPIRLDIEPTCRCNFRCVMCQVSAWENGKRADDMDYDSFCRFVETQYGLCEVKLQGMGEPMLHKRFVDMVNFLSDRDIWVRTTVNGSTLHINNAYEGLAQSGIGEIQASFDGATAEVFEGIRKRSNFELVVKNLTSLNAYSDKIGKLLTRMWVVLQGYNREQLYDFVALADRMGFRRLTISYGLSDWGQKAWSKSNSELQTNAISEREAEELLRLGGEYGIDVTFWNLKARYETQDINKICGWPFEWAYVGSDFRVAPCCMIANPDILELGRGTDFTKVWNNEAYQNFRKAHINGQIPNACKNCYLNLGSETK